MKVIYNIDKEKNLIKAKCSGNTSLDKVIETMTEIYNNPNFKTGMNAISDITEVYFDFSYNEFYELLNFNEATEQIRGKVKWAIILKPGDSHHMNLIRMFNEMNKVHGLRIQTQGFNAEVDALEWLHSEESK
ncbi:MAG: hypothetical protein ACXACY_28140 [Candidatus Hodarchaeales archaeon]|jgi:hypothetical protein